MDQVQEKSTSGISRRKVMQAGAWAVPVIAAAVAVPMAAASVSQASALSGATSTFSTSPVNPTPDEFRSTELTSAFTGGYLQISNVIGKWETGVLRLIVNNPPPAVNPRSYIGPDGNPIIGADVLNKTFVTEDGTIWLVESRNGQQLILSAASREVTGNGDVIRIQAPDITVTATYGGLWDEDDQQWGVLTTSYTVTAGNVGGSGGAQTTFPKDAKNPPTNP